MRKDWDADTGDLTLRLMPTHIHEYFLSESWKLVDKALDALVEKNQALVSIRKKIRGAGSAPVGEPPQKGKRASTFEKSPDGQWTHLDHLVPALVFEVAYSQEERKLLNTVQQYLMKKPGLTLVLFDLNYSDPDERAAPEHSHSAALGIWTSSVAIKPGKEGRPTKVISVRCIKKSTLFRHGGQSLYGHLEIPFELFCPVKERSSIPAELRHAGVSVSFSALAGLVAEAEVKQRLYDAQNDPRRLPSPEMPVETEFFDDDGSQVTELPFTSVSVLKRQAEGDAEAPAKKIARHDGKLRRSGRLGASSDESKSGSS